jgi:hypothetical protein
MRTQRLSAIAAFMALWSFLSHPLLAQDSRNEQFYFPGRFNWQFLTRYPEGGRLFNAFDYGHAVLYEKLYTRPKGLSEELETRQFNYLTTDLLVRPPRFAVAEETIEPAYSKLAWRAKMMFDWAHLLHRQVYDVYADERLSRLEQDAKIEELTDYYLSNARLAFAVKPKSMSLMDDQYFSQVFRREYPKFNGLIWAYHWLQVGLYEPLILGASVGEKKAGVQTTIARFWSMLKEPPARLPKVMPMSPVVAPLFSAAHPRAAIIFDNLHMTHDIISDILASDSVPRSRKREVIYAALDEMQDTTRNVMAQEEWKNMGEMMGGVAIMGGPATGLLAEVPTLGADVPSMKMAGMNHGKTDNDMSGMVKADSVKGNPAGMMPDMTEGAGNAAQGTGHDMGRMEEHPVAGDSAMRAHIQLMMEMHRWMMADPVMRQRMMADTTARRLMGEMIEAMPPKQRAEMQAIMRQAPGPVGRPAAPKPVQKKPRSAATDSMPGMEHRAMPGMSMPNDTTHH